MKELHLETDSLPKLLDYMVDFEKYADYKSNNSTGFGVSKTDIINEINRRIRNYPQTDRGEAVKKKLALAFPLSDTQIDKLHNWILENYSLI